MIQELWRRKASGKNGTKIALGLNSLMLVKGFYKYTPGQHLPWQAGYKLAAELRLDSVLGNFGNSKRLEMHVEK